ncbi:hypothetical protein PROPHIGD57-2_59 [Mycobacterium phage prophiGD57-2]|nr:hypothetical protein PHIGD23-1_95 [Mycobacterium phage phiGD23-1]QPO17699.1 hypothetical protein PHIGD22-1_95 [Mycobacterium phage phiGD22-1]QPO17875.1 hypothetical protein PROPHIGD20-1_93 [Mycobacterium phage phiGD20-1]QSM01787.1 hypothetical protein PROPHIGD11-1_60 [Mycobacterium phage prophiGD11-1]QSM02179.1 hypothetical protein PROPHIGD20-1_59 [Mycobacterium phage prophiGD20-1]QSM02528.1 hypothetical protein PROPHIGD17-2_56 [Mycobacterium phage prophiGD17-2]QSM02649.1 hypothetical prot
MGVFLCPNGGSLMPLSRVRCCIPCGRIRYAPCSAGCRVDPENDPTSWTEQVPPSDEAE